MPGKKNLQTIKSHQTSEPIRIPQTFRGIHPCMVYTWGHMSYNPSFFEGVCLKKNIQTIKSPSKAIRHPSPSEFRKHFGISGYTSLHGIHFETCVHQRRILSPIRSHQITPLRDGYCPSEMDPLSTCIEEMHIITVIRDIKNAGF